MKENSFAQAFRIVSVLIFATSVALSTPVFAHAQADLGYMGGDSNLGYMGADSFGSMGGDSNLGYMGGGSLGYMGGDSNLGYLGGNSLGYMGGDSNLGYLGGSPNDLGYMGGDSSLGYMGGDSNLGYMGGTPYTSGYSPSYIVPAYSSIPSYAQQYIPSYAQQYFPSNSSQYYFPTPTPTFTTPRSTAPSITSQSQSQAQSIYSPNTNVNTNSTGPSISSSQSNNTNNNTNTSTNTNNNNPVANASANTGPISINNVVNVAGVAQAQPQHNIQYTFPAPSCTIYASNVYNYGYGNNYSQPITLTWSSTNATSAYITPQVGSVNPSGSTTVYPSGYTTYTLTISGPGGSATCQSTANYNYTAAPITYAQPAAPAVSLTQIPYTGFDYGPVGNAIYWMSLMLFAAAAGYLMVYYRGGALAFAGSLFGSRTGSPVAQRSEENEEIEETPAAASVVTIDDEPQQEEKDFSLASLPTVENHRITSDSMIIERSHNAAPRIVIARA